MREEPFDMYHACSAFKFHWPYLCVIWMADKLHQSWVDMAWKSSFLPKFWYWEREILFPIVNGTRCQTTCAELVPKRLLHSSNFPLWTTAESIISCTCVCKRKILLGREWVSSWWDLTICINQHKKFFCGFLSKKEFNLRCSIQIFFKLQRSAFYRIKIC